MRQMLTRLARVAHSSHPAHLAAVLTPHVIVLRLPYIVSSSSGSTPYPPLPQRPLTVHARISTNHSSIMGSIVSAIASAIGAVVFGIADIIMIIVSVIVTIIVTIFDIIFDILCCNCFGGRQRRTGRHKYRFGGRRGASSTY
ncbi:hypothetical protein C8Q73DRAFT_78753 [Cubamyces lactineus]|nr:hypothetical protein C8Q73DRAFT_78753 [Cubamyces lactineus]